jgi:hypothetical protein
MGETERGIEVLTGILDTQTEHPKIHQIHELIGDIFVEMRKYEEAAEHFNEAIIMKPNDSSPYLK